jgi:hypothetical protein
MNGPGESTPARMGDRLLARMGATASRGNEPQSLKTGT